MFNYNVRDIQEKSFTGAFLSSCRPVTCNLVKIESPVQMFSCKFCEISENNFMQNSFELLLLNVERRCDKRYSRS